MNIQSLIALTTGTGGADNNSGEPLAAAPEVTPFALVFGPESPVTPVEIARPQTIDFVQTHIPMATIAATADFGGVVAKQDAVAFKSAKTIAATPTVSTPPESPAFLATRPLEVAATVQQVATPVRPHTPADDVVVPQGPNGSGTVSTEGRPVTDFVPAAPKKPVAETVPAGVQNQADLRPLVELKSEIVSTPQFAKKGEAVSSATPAPILALQPHSDLAKASPASTVQPISNETPLADDPEQVMHSSIASSGIPAIRPDNAAQSVGGDASNPPVATRPIEASVIQPTVREVPPTVDENPFFQDSKAPESSADSQISAKKSDGFRLDFVPAPEAGSTAATNFKVTSRPDLTAQALSAPVLKTRPLPAGDDTTPTPPAPANTGHAGSIVSQVVPAAPIQPMARYVTPLEIRPMKAVPQVDQTAPVLPTSGQDVTSSTEFVPTKPIAVTAEPPAVTQLPVSVTGAGMDRVEISPIEFAARADAAPANTSATSVLPQQPAHIATEYAPRVIQMIAESARALQDRPVEIALSPEELGRVRMTLTAVDGAMTVSVSVERAETLELLRRNIDMLADQLRESGFQTLNFEFQEQRDGDAADGSADGYGAVQDAASDPSDSDQPTPHLLNVAADGGMDIRL